MFARQTLLQFRIERIDEAIKIVKKSIVPTAKAQKGFQGLYLLLDRKTGKAVSIAMWDKEEDAIANEESHYYQEQLVKLMHLYTAPPIREGYEVIVKP